MPDARTFRRPRVRALLILALALCGLFACGRTAKTTAGQLPYRDPRLSVEQRVEDLLGRMTAEEKFRQLFMAPGDLAGLRETCGDGVLGLQVAVDGAWAAAETVNAVQKFLVEGTRLGIPAVPFDEALHGLVRGGATAFPQAIGLAAAWDPELMSEVAAAIAEETRSRGIRQVLSPVVNIARDVRWGRTEETYGEDPYLSARLAAAFVRAFEERGVITTPKHFVANVGAGGRDSYPVPDGERELREGDFVPFEAAVGEGGARSIMTAYNSWDGRPCSAHPRLLQDILKGEWGFKGFVISDAGSVGGMYSLHLTADSFADAARQAWTNGLDVLLQAGLGQAPLFRDAAVKGLAARARIDDAVRRVLRAKFELGLFEDPYVDPEEAERTNGAAEHRALAKKAAEEAVVLLKNEGRALPLNERAVKSIAVIGPDAVEARLGGYSRPGGREVALLDAIRERAAATPGLAVRYAEGCGRAEPAALRVIDPEYLRPTTSETGPDPAGAIRVGIVGSVDKTGGGQPGAGLLGEYFANADLAGEPAARRVDPKVDFHWTFVPPAEGLGTGGYSARWTGSVMAPEAGPRLIGVEGDGFRLWLDGRLVIDRWREVSYGTARAEVRLEKGRTYEVKLEFHEPVRGGRVRLVWDYGVKDDSWKMIEAAVDLARSSDLALIAAGIEEGEGRDRSDIRLPGRQEEMIRRIAATGTPTVVIIYGGSAVEMGGWIGVVRAVLLAWYPGEAGGEAVADILWGEANPSGRLPITFPRSVGQLPLVYDHKPTGRLDDYLDSTGEPLFPFGFGLSYTEFRYAGLAVAPGAMAADGAARISCTVTNAGPVAGAEVVQLYLHDPLASVVRPVLELEGFKKVFLEPGASTTVTLELGPAELSHIDANLRRIVEPGEFEIYLGSSSRDIRLKGRLLVRRGQV
jgi:beta-glucosidase